MMHVLVVVHDFGELVDGDGARTIMVIKVRKNHNASLWYCTYLEQCMDDACFGGGTWFVVNS